MARSVRAPSRMIECPMRVLCSLRVGAEAKAGLMAQRPGPHSAADDSLPRACAVHLMRSGGSRGRTRQAAHVTGHAVHACAQ